MKHLSKKQTCSCLILLILCVLNLVVLLPLPGKFSYVFNENGRLASGLIHIRTGDYSVFHVNPPLPDMVGALPAFLSGNYCPTLGDLGITLFGRKEHKAGDVWIEKNPDHFRWMKYGRFCMLGFVLLGTVAVFLLAHQSFGVNAAMVASLLWIFSPYILGHGCLICPDVPSATLAMFAIFTFLKWLHRKNMYAATFAGIVLGIAELTKFTLLIFYPLFIVLWLVYCITESRERNNEQPDVTQHAEQSCRYTSLRSRLTYQAKQMFVMFAVSLLVINMGYLFEGTGKPLGSFRFQTALFSGVETLKDVPSGGGNRFKDSEIGYIPVILPANYIQGIDTQRLDFERGMPSYLRGQWSDHGWWYYYLYALLIKTPLGTLGLLLLAIYCTFFIKECNASWRDEVVILLPGIALLVFVSSQTGFSVHSRYVIPALPFFFIWISKVGKAISWKRPVFSTIVAILLLWSVGSSLWVYPHSISYFNGLVGGPLNGPRHLLDSNIDWGQDLFYLERWCRAHPNVTSIRGALWGSYPLEATDIPIAGMPPANVPEPGWYAVSVNYIYDRSGQYRYFLNHEPVAKAGYSIYIYYLTQEDVERFLH